MHVGKENGPGCYTAVRVWLGLCACRNTWFIAYFHHIPAQELLDRASIFAFVWLLSEYLFEKNVHKMFYIKVVNGARKKLLIYMHLLINISLFDIKLTWIVPSSLTSSIYFDFLTHNNICMYTYANTSTQLWIKETEANELISTTVVICLIYVHVHSTTLKYCTRLHAASHYWYECYFFILCVSVKELVHMFAKFTDIVSYQIRSSLTIILFESSVRHHSQSLLIVSKFTLCFFPFDILSQMVHPVLLPPSVRGWWSQVNHFPWCAPPKERLLRPSPGPWTMSRWPGTCRASEPASTRSLTAAQWATSTSAVHRFAMEECIGAPHETRPVVPSTKRA